MRAPILFLMAGLTLAGCAGKTFTGRDRVNFDGLYFRGKVQVEKTDKTSFAVTVGPVSQGLVQAREAGRYEATKYCVAQFGNSEVIWTHGPDAPEAELRIADDRMSLQGRCVG